MRYPLVSVVISTKNEQQNIQKCLDSIKHQSYPQKNIEIIVVDNFSTDRTAQISEKYTSLIFLRGNERSKQRNYGMIKKAKGKYGLYLDADMQLTKHVIHSCVIQLEKNNEFIGLYIPEEIIGKSIWVKIRNFERSFFVSTPIDAIRFFRLKDFIKIEGFDEKLRSFEDWDLTKRFNALGNFSTIKEPILHDETFFSVRKFIQKKIIYDEDFMYYVSKWKNQNGDTKKQFSLLYRGIFVFIENDKWKKILKNPQYLLGIYTLRILLFFSIIFHRLWKKF